MHSSIAAFHISMVPSRWYKDTHQDHIVSEDSMIFYNEEGALNLDLNSRTLLLICKPATIPVTASITGAVQKRHQYGRIWGLAREATLLAVNTSDEEIIQIR